MAAAGPGFDWREGWRWADVHRALVLLCLLLYLPAHCSLTADEAEELSE